jgi:hypothetical protein
MFEESLQMNEPNSAALPSEQCKDNNRNRIAVGQRRTLDSIITGTGNQNGDQTFGNPAIGGESDKMDQRSYIGSNQSYNWILNPKLNQKQEGGVSPGKPDMMNTDLNHDLKKGLMEQKRK